MRRSRFRLGSLVALAPALVGLFVVACEGDASNGDLAARDGGPRVGLVEDGGADARSELPRDAAPASDVGAGATDARPDVAPPSGTPRTLASGQGHPRGIAIGGGSAYFTVSEDAVLRRVGVDGGAVETLATGLEDAFAVAVDDTHAYVGTYHPQGVVVRVPVSGGPAETLATSQAYATSVAVVGGEAFFTTATAVRSVPVMGGPITTHGEQLSGPNGIAIGAGAIFATLYNGGSIVRSVGGVVSTVVSGQSFPSGIVLAGQGLYYTCTGDGTVRSVLPDGGSAHVVTSGWGYPLAIVTDGSSLYFTTAAGDVVRVGTDGSGLTLLATHEQGPEGIAIDATTVY